ncbi:MAG: MotA/TolQ/ExbB proton channel family protein [Deltaproteobacteria bacterium]|nr:MotA/TolQ/ExbB proton channel family protein [Deltaproteobacteria bacterium]
MLLLAALLAPASRALAESELEKAYQQEIQLLETERGQLRARVEQLEAKSRQEAAGLRAEVTRLSEQLTSLQLGNQALEETLGSQAEEVRIGDDRQALLDNALDQAISTLRRNGVGVEPGGEDPRPLIEALFRKGCRLAERLGKLRVERGPYFALDGSERQADILWLSQVAAICLDPNTGGALGPAGSGALKVIRPESLRQARALVAGKGPDLTGMLLFDPLEREAHVAGAERTLWETFLAGGFVMWPILVLAAMALLILLERLLVLGRVHTNAARLMKRVGEHMSRGQWRKAAEACHREPGAVARVLGTILRHREQPRPQLEELVDESILAERPTLERFLPALNVIAAVAPLLGLLGTVTGMIGTFHVITEHGTGDPRLLSGGISEALLTTQFGLIVAIPTLLVHSLLSSRVLHVLSDMETNALRLLNEMHCEHCELLKRGGCRGAQNGEPQCPNLTRGPGRAPAEPEAALEGALGEQHA